MSTVFPDGVDNLTNPSSGTNQNALSHASQHANINDAMEAVQGYLLDPDGLPQAAVRAVASVAALRTLSKTGNLKALTLSYHGNGDLGSTSLYLYDSSDTTSTDNGGSIIVANDGGRWKISQLLPLSVKQFGAKGDNVADDTSPWQRAVAWCRSESQALRVTRPTVAYRVTGSIVLASDTLAPVNVFGESPQWYGNETIKVIGNFNDAVFKVSGTNLTYATAPKVSNVTVINLNTGGAACGFRGDYSGGFALDYVRIQARNFGVYSAGEMISPVFNEVCIDTDSGASNGTGVAGYKIVGRNTRIYGGRVYAQQVCFDYIGDTLAVFGTNCEFSQVIFRHGALASAVFVGCHLETSQVLVTNANTLPISFSGNWADNGSAGVGITGSVRFIGGSCFFTGGTYGARSNLAVIKGSGGFTYSLDIDGMAIAHPNPYIGGSFTPGAATALPSGTKIRTRGIEGVTVRRPPNDSFSGWELEGTAGKVDLAKSAIESLTWGIQTTTAVVATAGTVIIPTPLGQFASAVCEIAWRANTSGYEYTGAVEAVQSFATVVFGTRRSSTGAASADANFTVTWDGPTASFILTNNYGAPLSITVNFQIKHRMT